MANPAMKWTKGAGDIWTARVGPFGLKVQPKGDGRWIWLVTKADAANPEATGVGSSLGAAKTATEQYVRRSGLV
ncbi:hypothetical protein [Labilithrix luteola]|uniref:hypothetical protein n=1 Tax=Labilithrix luteola TaxID=1391654 RepID=UPI0011BAADC4|nr:hypothetical protein [Labilithrix luteola]